MKFTLAPTLIAALAIIPTGTQAYSIGSNPYSPFSVAASRRQSQQQQQQQASCRPQGGPQAQRRRARRSVMGDSSSFGGFMTPADIQAMQQFGTEVFQQAARTQQQQQQQQQHMYSPQYQVLESDDKFQVSLDVPGVKMEDLSINLEEKDGKILTLSGSRDRVSDSGNAYNSKFSQSFYLQDPTIDTDKISANLENGVLVVTAPKIVPPPVEDSVKSIPITVLDTSTKDEAVSNVNDEVTESLVNEMDNELNGEAASAEDIPINSKNDEKEADTSSEDEESASA